jgi:HPt (histidine-containing phosphotransfer) domain-containing protein
VSDALDTSALQALRESTGDDDAFLADLVMTFLDESPEQVAELRAAVAGADAGDVRPARTRSSRTGRHSESSG